MSDRLESAMNSIAVSISLDQLGPLGHVFDAIPDGIVLADESGRIQLVNHQAELLFGYAHDDLSGRPIETLLPERFRTAHPSHRASYVAQPHVRPMGTGLQLFGLRGDGGEFPVEISLSPITVADTPLVLATIRDVTVQRSLERAAREELEGRLAMLRTILDQLPEDVYLVRGSDARLVLANRRVAQMWGAEWPEDQPMAEFLAASGTRVYDLEGRELRVEQLATLHALCTGESVQQQQETLQRADGVTLPVMVNAIALDPRMFPYLSEAHLRPSSPLPLALVVHQDVSALKEAERLKDEFIALAAHELRNPVASLTGYAQMLVTSSSRQRGQAGPGRVKAKRRRLRTKQMPDEWRADAVASVIEAANRLTTLTDDLLDVARLNANRLTLRPEPIELGALIRRVVKRLQVTSTAERHPITAQAPDETVVVVADGQRIEQVLTNLLTNAIKYSPEGGAVDVTLSTDSSPSLAATLNGGDAAVSDATQCKDNRPSQPRATGATVARISVRDQGMGIPDNQQDHIFGRFVRAENVRLASIPGTGLGLYVCRELLERQGGRIWFESVEGHGATFTFELPMFPPLDDDADGGES